MSNTLGKVYKDKVVVGYYEYYGTCDIVEPTIRKTAQEVYDLWRKPEYRKCTCGKPSEDVILYSDYGDGFHWSGKACLTCLVVVEGINVYDIDTTEGEPT